MAAKQEVTIEEAEGAVTVSTWARAPSAGVALHICCLYCYCCHIVCDLNLKTQISK